MSKIFNQSWRDIFSEILDNMIYMWELISTDKKNVGTCLVDPDRPQRVVTIEDGDKYSILYSKNGNIVKMGIVKPFKSEDWTIPSSKITFCTRPPQDSVLLQPIQAPLIHRRPSSIPEQPLVLAHPSRQSVLAA